MQNWKEMANTARSMGMKQTLIEVLETRRLLIEYHRGILAYGTEEILVGASFGRVRVTGAGLRLCCMSREQLFIAGQIAGITLERRES